MKIILRTVGGFAGPLGAETRTIDLDELPPTDAERFRSHVEKANVSDLPSKLLKTAPQSWDFVRHLRIEDGERVKEMQFHDEAATAPLRALVAAIESWRR